MSVDDLIRQHRTAEATVTVTAGGQPLAYAEVTVAQTGHKFLFGSTGFEFIPLANDEIQGEERAEMEKLADEWLTRQERHGMEEADADANARRFQRLADLLEPPLVELEVLVPRAAASGEVFGA